jgi:hypothetical protein
MSSYRTPLVEWCPAQRTRCLVDCHHREVDLGVLVDHRGPGGEDVTPLSR